MAQCSILRLQTFIIIHVHHQIHFQMTQVKLRVYILQFASNKIWQLNCVLKILQHMMAFLFKTSTSYHNKTIVWILFPNQKIGVLTRKKSTHFYIDNIQPNWTPIDTIIKDIRISKNNRSYYNKNSISNSIGRSKNHSPIIGIIIR